MKLVASVFDVVALLACLIGGFQIITAMGGGASAPQQAAGVAFGIGIAVVPHCLAAVFHRGAVRDLLTKIADRT